MDNVNKWFEKENSNDLRQVFTSNMYHNLISSFKIQVSCLMLDLYYIYVFFMVLLCL